MKKSIVSQQGGSEEIELTFFDDGQVRITQEEDEVRLTAEQFRAFKLVIGMDG